MYPTPHALCSGNLADLEQIVAPLGFHYRAQEMKDLACVLVERHGGKVPMDLRALLDLPGVGDYSARAVLCFAGDQQVPVVDTNVARLIYRIFDLPGPLPANPARKRILIQAAASLIPTGKADRSIWLSSTSVQLSARHRTRSVLDARSCQSAASGGETGDSPDEAPVSHAQSSAT
jgi:A/G-specific adenine glycosylase